MIRDAIQAYLAADREAWLDNQIVQGYQRMPQGREFDVDQWGDIGWFVTALTADTMRRLSAEEQEAGHYPW